MNKDITEYRTEDCKIKTIYIFTKNAKDWVDIVVEIMSSAAQAREG
jgi:hypothetical protein